MLQRPLPETADGQLPDGLYLGLPEDIYFAQRSLMDPRQRALGTSDLAKLWLNGAGWWWQSPNNPFFRGFTSESRTMGSATHCLMLEGRSEFDKRFAVAPNPKHYENLLSSTADLKSALIAANAPMPRSTAPKADFVEAAKLYCSDRPIWDDIMHRFARKNVGKDIIEAEDYFNLQAMLETAADDPDISIVTTAAGGPPLVEVSVFYTLPDGIRVRYRFDSILPPCNADLKTLDNYQNKSITEAVGKSISDYALDVQAAMSFEARRWAYHYIMAGEVYGGTQEQVDWLELFPALHPAGTESTPYFLWLFIQKPDASGREPVIMPVKMFFGSQPHLDGYRKAMWGLNTYRENLAKFGLAKPWRRVEAVRSLQSDGGADQNAISVPFWSKRPNPWADEIEAMSW